MKKLLLTLFVALTSVCASAITIDDLCGVYNRHMDNRKTMGGMGAAQIRDITVTITAKDANTVVLSGMLDENCPLEGTVDFEAKTINFDHQTVGWQGDVAYVLRNAWGDTPDDEAVVARIGEDGTITMGDEDEAYAGFCFSIPEAGITMFNMYGIITLTKDQTVLWRTNASFQLGEGTNISGEGVLTACASSVGYDYTLTIGEWGKYELQIKKNEDGSLSLYNSELDACVTDTTFWWMKWYADFNYDYAYDYLWVETVGENGEALSGVSGDANGGSIWFMAEYAAYNSANEEDAPAVYEPETRFTITWGTPQEDAVKGIEASKGNAAVYNIAGQRVNRATKGIFIQNGKKYVVK